MLHFFLHDKIVQNEEPLKERTYREAGDGGAGLRIPPVTALSA